MLRRNVFTLILMIGLFFRPLQMNATSPEDIVNPIEKVDTSLYGPGYRHFLSSSPIPIQKSLEKFHFDLDMDLSHVQTAPIQKYASFRKVNWSDMLINMASSYGIIDMNNLKNNYQDLLQVGLSVITSNWLWLNENELVDACMPSDNFMKRSGFENLRIDPSLGFGSTGIRCTYRLNFGKLSSFWNMGKQNLSIKLQIPLYRLPHEVLPNIQYVMHGVTQKLTAGTKTAPLSIPSVASPPPSLSNPEQLDSPATDYK
jgi:hypothetical protein